MNIENKRRIEIGNLMETKQSLKTKLIISIFIGCLIPYFLGGMYLKSFMENWLYEKSLENTNQVLLQVSELIDQSLIIHMSEIVSMLATDDRTINVDDTINNYTEYENQSYEYRDSDTEKSIEAYFKAIKENHHAINFVFLGTEDGGYIEYPRFKPSDKYNPTLRPWYLNTIHSNQVIISDPYITTVTQDMIISFTKKISVGTQDLGVVGIAVKTEDLLESIGSIRLGDTGYIVVLNDSNKIIISPKDNDWILKTPEELEIQLLNKVDAMVGKAFEGQLKDEVKIVNSYISPISGWKLLSIVSKEEILRESREMTNILIGIYLLTLLVILAVVYIVSNKFTEPILWISNIISKGKRKGILSSQ